MEEIVKKMEERLADIEDKQDSDYESNKGKFLELEDLHESLTSQQKNYEEDIRDLRHQLELSNIKQNELQRKIDHLEEAREISDQHEEKREEGSGVSELVADIEVLREKVAQQSGDGHT